VPLCPETFQSLRYGHAACHSARAGAFMLGLAGSIKASPALLGHSAVTPLLRLWQSFGLDDRSFRIGAALFVLVGFWQLVMGLRSAASHDDDFSITSFAISAGVALAIFTYWDDAPRMLGFNAIGAALVHAFFLALLADCAMNCFYLQLRGFLPRRVPPVAGTARVGAGAQIMTQAQNARLAVMAGERDRALADCDRMARLLEVQHEAAGLLTFPGVSRAVLVALHPDRATTEADKRLATARFQTAQGVLEKIRTPRR